MKTKEKKLSHKALDSLIRFHLIRNDDLNGYELVDFKAQENNANPIVRATLSHKDKKERLKIITLDLKMLKSLVIDALINEVWTPLYEWECNK